MAVSTEHTKDIFMGDGVNTKFQPTFQIIENEQINCLKVLASGEEIEVLNTEFEIRLINGGANGAEITYPLVGSPLEEGSKLIIYRQTEIKNDYAPPNGQVFDAVAIRTEIDRLTMQNQEQEEALSRSVQLSMGSGAKPEEYLDNVNEMLANARKLQEDTVLLTEQNIKDAKAQVEIAAEKAEEATKSANAAATSAKSAASAVEGFDVHVAEMQTVFDDNAAEKTEAFNTNAEAKQTAVNDSTELARKYAQGTEAELPSGSAEVWAKKAEEFCNKTEIQPQSIYHDIIELDSAVITVQDRKCWYRRTIVANDTFTIDLSAIKNVTRCFIIDLIIVNPDALPFDLSTILPLGEGETADNNKKWLGKSTPSEIAEAGEHWIAIFTMDGGQTWRASYEGPFEI